MFRNTFTVLSVRMVPIIKRAERISLRTMKGNRLPEIIQGAEFRQGLRHVEAAARSGGTNFCTYLTAERPG